MKKHPVLLLTALLAVFASAGIWGFWKFNQKINNLHESYETLEKHVEESIEELRGEIAAQASETEEENRNLTVIPDLDPHGEGWKITQFGDVNGAQENCYTITTANGLAIVDGGFAYEEPRLREIIAQYGNSVDAWILTHPHGDHMTAFLDIYKDPQGIVFHHIYTPEMPDLSVMMENADWDDYTLLEELNKLEIPQLEYLHNGDERSILGLRMKVLSAYDDEIDKISDDLMNDGSLVFKLSGEKESMLFCADAGDPYVNEELSERIIREYGDELPSDYLQLGHHGFGGLTPELYDIVDAEGVFIDAPALLLTSTEFISARENDLRMEEQGRVVFSFYTAPNQVLLR